MKAENSTISHRVPWEQGQTYRAKASVEGPGNLGDSDAASDGCEHS